jgi:spore germination protein KB
MKLERISTLQIVLLLFACRMTTTFIYLPLLTPPGNQDIWVSVLGAIPTCMIVLFPLIYLSNKFPEENLIQYCQRIMGKIFGNIISLLFIGFLLCICIAIMADLVNFIHTSILPETPPYAIMITMLIPCIYTIYKGLESIGRMCEFLIPYFIFSIIIFTVFNIPRMDFNVFLPILADSKIQDIALGSFGISARFYDMLILAMLVPHLQKKQDIKKISLIYVVLSVLFLFVFAVTTQAVLGIEFSKHISFPYYKFVRTIEVFDFIERIESLVVIAWIIIEFIKFSLYMYCITKGLGQIFNIKKDKLLIIPLSSAIFMFLLISKIINSVTINKIVLFIPYVGAVPLFVLPAFILIVYFFRRKALN